MYYEEVFRQLNKFRVKYAVAGGVATVLYGAVRFTADLDIIIDMSCSNIDRLFRSLTDFGYKPRLPVTVEEFKDEKRRREWIR